METAVQPEEFIVKPQPGGQTDFLSRGEFEVLFGGAAGPGKSWSLVIDALGLQFEQTKFGMKAIEHPDYRAVLFRRETTQFGKLIDESKKYYYDFGGEFVLGRRGDPGPSWNFPNRKSFVSGKYYSGRKEGARVFICHLQMEDDKENHQGQEYQYVGFDELTQFTLTQYLYLFSRVRSTLENNGYYLPGRVRGTTNPMGPGLAWVKKRFIRMGSVALKPTGKYYFVADRTVKDVKDNPMGKLVRKKDPEFKEAKSRTFIPGLLHENKILMKRDPGYAYNIMQMGAKAEKALLHGDWDAFGGDFFDDFDRSKMVIKPFPIPEDWILVGSLDPGWASYCSFGLRARDYLGNSYRLFTYYAKGYSTEQHAKKILKMIKEFPYTKGRLPDLIVAGADAFHKETAKAVIKTELTFAKIFHEVTGLILKKATTDRIIGWWVMKQFMRNITLKKKVNGYYLFKHFNEPLLDQITSAQSDEDEPEDIAGKGNDPDFDDHCLDEDRYNLMALPVPWKESKQDIPEYLKEYYHIDDKIKHTVMSQ